MADWQLPVFYLVPTTRPSFVALAFSDLGTVSGLGEARDYLQRDSIVQTCLGRR